MGHKGVKNVLVTGGCGYLGSQVIRDLATQLGPNVKIRILDNMQAGNYDALRRLPKGDYEFVEGDILNRSALRYALNGIYTVIHLAAVVKTPMSFEHATWTEQVNHWGTVNVVEACIEAKVQQLIYVSSTAVYGPGGPFSEDHVCAPQGAYAISKWQAENSVRAGYARGLNTTILRIGTLYGTASCMRFDAFVNRLAYLGGIGRPLTIFGDGEQKRPVVHVRDASRMCLFAMSHFHATRGEVINVVGQNPSVHEVTELIRSLRPSIQVRYTDQNILTQVSMRVASSILESMNWEPQYSLIDGIKEVLDDFQCIRQVSTSLEKNKKH